jgi:hypothetical protein
MSYADSLLRLSAIEGREENHKMIVRQGTLIICKLARGIWKSGTGVVRDLQPSSRLQG